MTHLERHSIPSVCKLIMAPSKFGYDFCHLPVMTIARQKAGFRIDEMCPKQTVGKQKANP